MSAGLAVFDTTVQDANLWLKEMERGLRNCSRQEAYAALRALLHAVRGCLPAHAAVNFAAQLPMLLRGVYYEGWTLPERPLRIRSIEDFVDAVAAPLPVASALDVFCVIREGLAAISMFTGEGETEKLRAQLPAVVSEYWRCIERAPNATRIPDV